MYKKKHTNCLRCGNPLGRQIKWCDSCSKIVRTEYSTDWARTHQGKPLIEKLCGVCGNPFVTRRPKQDKYCSKECLRESAKKSDVQKHTRATTNRARRAVVKGLPRNLTFQQWKDALDFFDNRCAYCGNKLIKAHREHFVPVKRGGGLTSENIVPACPSCNSRKSSKDPLDWLVMQPKGLLAYARVSLYLAQK